MKKLGVSYATLSRAVKQAEKREGENVKCKAQPDPEIFLNVM